MANERYEAMKTARIEFLYQRIEQLQNFLAGNDPVLLMSIDGVQTQFDRSGAREEVRACMGELARLEGRRPGMTNVIIDL